MLDARDKRGIAGAVLLINLACFFFTALSGVIWAILFIASIVPPDPVGQARLVFFISLGCWAVAFVPWYFIDRHWVRKGYR